MSERSFPPRLVERDSWLEPYESVIRYRMQRVEQEIAIIEAQSGSIKNYASSHLDHGLQYNFERKSWWFSDWLPEAQEVSLVGDFNDWDSSGYHAVRDDHGVWTIHLPLEGKLVAGQRYKMRVRGKDGVIMDRIPSTTRRVVQDLETKDFAAVVNNFFDNYSWRNTAHPQLTEAPLIYEAHIGISGEDETVHTYRYFADHVIPRIKSLGYNAIQLMAVAEHPYYGSFGYHVSSFFASSSRFGSENDLKYLIDTAHEESILVLLDIVHAHSVKNTAEGLNNFDGSGGQYFHDDERGDHPDWDSKCFDYSNPKVRQFLLSNLRYWMEEFHVDGFRFDGVTSMLYWHRGNENFSEYKKYYNQSVDNDAVLYLQLATSLIRRLNPFALIIAEDMSGMPGLCRPISEGGMGFTHRLTMGIPDYWIQLLKEKKDEDWDLEEVWHIMTNRRSDEAHIAYCESHDQALVGDKTLAFRLMDQEMYWHMAKNDEHILIDRGLALHKLIRLLTFSAGGDGYLTFMGNEFGHPEWIDFPRSGNNWSYQYARRQWSLVDNAELRYGDLNQFEHSMLSLEHRFQFLSDTESTSVRIDQHARVLSFSRGELLFVFNFSPSKSHESFEIPISREGEYQLLLNSDHIAFSGHGRLDERVKYSTSPDQKFLKLYLPTRTALVLKATE